MWWPSSNILVTVMMSVTVVTLVANLLVVEVVRRHRRLHRKENVFIVSLAVSDLLMVPVMALAAGEHQYGHWDFGEPLCRLWLAMDNMCSFASIMNICSISVVRYIRTNNPFRYHQVVTRRYVVTVISLTWLLAALGASPQAFAGSLENFECKDTLEAEILIVYCVCTFYLPCLLMLVIYWQLYSLSRRHLNNARQLRPFGECQRNYKAAITIGVMMGVFLVCFMPMYVSMPFRKQLKQHWVFETCKWLAYLNSMLDPLLYSAMNKTFRQSVNSSYRYYITRGSTWS